MTKQEPQSQLSRRAFLTRSSFAAGAISVLPGHVLGLNGAPSPNEKLNIAGVGVAGQGHSDLRQFKDENIVALCDVDWRHAAGTFREFPQAKPYKDYRKMLGPREGHRRSGGGDAGSCACVCVDGRDSAGQGSLLRETAHPLGVGGAPGGGGRAEGEGGDADGQPGRGFG